MSISYVCNVDKEFILLLLKQEMLVNEKLPFLISWFNVMIYYDKIFLVMNSRFIDN